MSQESESVSRIRDGRSWEEFCDSLKAAGAVVLADGAPTDAFNRAEGFRYLTRLLRGALETFVEAGDPGAPELRRVAHETIKMGMDNPDNIYLSAPINGNFEYRITGTRGSVHYLGFGTQAGNYGSTGTLETTGYLEAQDLQIDSDGRFEIILSAKEQAGNWLPMKPQSRTVVVRQTRLDHRNEIPAELHIERSDAPSQPRPLSAEKLDRGLKGAAAFVAGCSKIFRNWAEGFKRHPNELPRFDPETARVAGGDPNIAYYHGYWKLAAGEALVIEVMPPECDYWNFQVSNYWLESLDYRYFPIHINNHTGVLRPDGSVRVVLAHENPGVDNWLSTCGHFEGTMCWRWIKAKEHPQPQTRVVKLETLER